MLLGIHRCPIENIQKDHEMSHDLLDSAALSLQLELHSSPTQHDFPLGFRF
jgi:hypothetical protein